MSRFKILLIIICFSSLILKGQQNLDSLRQALSYETRPEKKMQQYLLLSSAWSVPNQDSAKYYIRKALAFSEKIEDKKYRVEALNHWANYLQRQSLLDSAMQVYDDALVLAESLNYLKGLAKITNNISIVHNDRGDYALSLESLYKSLRYEDQLGNKHGIAEVYGNIGVIFFYQKEYDKSLSYLKRALDVYLEVNDEVGIIQQYNNIGGVNEMLGRTDSALYYYQKSLRRAEATNDEDEISLALSNMANLYKNRGEYEKAEAYFAKAVAISESINDYNGLADFKLKIAQLHQEQKSFKLALSFYQEALSLSKKYGFKDTRAGIYKHLMKLYEEQGDFEQSLYYSKNLKDLNDSIFNETKSRAIAEAETRYESAKKDQALAEQEAQLVKEQLRLKQKNQWIIILIASLSIIMLLAVFLYRQQNLKQDRLKSEALLKQERAKAELREKMEAERTRISRDLHDHIGTQLTIIGANIDKLAFKEKEEDKRTYLEDISVHSRDTMHQLRETIWAMNVDGINMKMLVGKLQEFFRRANQGGKSMLIDNACEEDLLLSPNQTIALFRICQEAANNAIKYADFKTFKISFRCESNCLHIEIKDDGVGADLKDSGKGYGLSNMEQRAKEIGAIFKLESTIGKGLSILMKIELNPQVELEKA